MRISVALPALMLVLAPAAQAAMLYKSVGPNGTVMFSDMPPSGDAKLLEQREIGSSSPSPSSTSDLRGFDLAAQLVDADAAVARASAQVDQAEHALAEARRGTWSPRDGIGVQPTKTSPQDLVRIDYFQKGVKIARQQLLDVLRERKRG
jgi:hypothetical protein